MLHATPTPPTGSAADPVTHYDRITRAWQYLLGEDFHYGYFKSADETLDVATNNLTVLMAEKGRMAADVSVLDVGCGIGSPACFLAKRYACRVTGITTSPNGVEHAQARARREGCADRVSFMLRDGMDNGMPDASFDRVWVLEASHLMPRKDALFAEAARVLRPGGTMVLCDIMPRREVGRDEILRHSRDFLHLHYAFGHAKLETLASYRRLAEGAGLAVREAIDISDPIFPTLEHWRRKLDENGDEVRALIGDEGVAHFRASCEALPRLWNELIFGYGLIAATKR